MMKKKYALLSVSMFLFVAIAPAIHTELSRCIQRKGEG
jgi:hypothetical protein